MNASVPPIVERRDDPRVAAGSPARMEAPDTIFAQTGPAVIEEVSACGLRLRTELQLHPDEALVLKVAGEALPLHADVMWVRQAPPGRFGSHKAWIAGCRLRGESIARARLSLKPDIRPGRASFFGRKAVLVAGVIGFVALLVYLYLRFAMLIGGGAEVLKMK